MRYEFEVEMSVSKIYDYMLKTTLGTPQGIIGEGAGLIILVIYFFTSYAILFCIGLLAMLYIPLTLYIAAKKQMSTLEIYKAPIQYVLSNYGIELVAGDLKQRQSWNDIVKVGSTAKSIFIYTSSKEACVLPKEDMKGQEKDIIDLIRKKMPKEKVSIV